MMKTSYICDAITSRLAESYELQPSPASVDSMNSADNGTVGTAATYDSFDKEFSTLKTFSTRASSSYLSHDENIRIPPSSLEIPLSDDVNSVVLTTPEVINLLKDDVNQFDDAASEYNFGEAGSNASPNIYTRSVAHENKYVQESKLRNNPYCLSVEYQARRESVQPLNQAIGNQSSLHAMPPIDMKEQEVIKTERKRLRNRIAASKCRKRKLERISRLEEKVVNLKQQNIELSTNANILRQQVAELKTKVMSHVSSGCHLMMSQQQLVF